MAPKKIARINAILFFTFWLLVLYAGADHPLPPPGFIVVILLDALAALLVYLRVPDYINWASARKKNRLWYVLRDGLAAGVAFALLAVLLPGGGEPGMPPPGAMDYAIWFIVLGVVGAANATAIYFINALIAGKFQTR